MAAGLLLASVLAVLTLLAVTGALRVRRYSRRHIVASLAVHGRGIDFTRRPDGDRWKLRLRERRCRWPSSGEEPPDNGAREPRPPAGPNPASGVRLHRP